MSENAWFSGLDFDMELKRKWGLWSYNKSEGYVPTLCHSEGYEVDLTECNTSAEILDWIFQLAGKSWANDNTVADLIRALEDLLDPQANVCAWGIDRPFDSRLYLQKGVTP